MTKGDSMFKIKFIGTIVLLFFSLCACVTGTLSWFKAHHMNDTDNNMKIINSGQILKKISFHDCLSIDNDNYAFSKKEIGSIICNDDGSFSYIGETNPIMGEYSLFRKTHPFLMLIELKKEYTNADDLFFNVTASTDYDFLGAFNENGELKKQLASFGNPLSSVIEFSNITFDSQTSLDATLGEVDSNEIYLIDKTKLSIFNSFVKFTSDNYSYDRFDSTVTMYEPNNGDIVKYVGIVFDYYETAVEYIYSVNIGNPVLEQFDANIRYSCDWELII